MKDCKSVESIIASYSYPTQSFECNVQGRPTSTWVSSRVRRCQYTLLTRGGPAALAEKPERSAAQGMRDSNATGWTVNCCASWLRIKAFIPTRRWAIAPVSNCSKFVENRGYRPSAINLFHSKTHTDVLSVCRAQRLMGRRAKSVLGNVALAPFSQ